MAMLRKLSAIILIIVLVANPILLILRRINELGFWIILGVCALAAHLFFRHKQ